MPRFLAKPKMIAAGGLSGAVHLPEGPGRCLGEGVGAKPPNNVVFVFVFFRIKHADTVIVRVNIG